MSVSVGMRARGRLLVLLLACAPATGCGACEPDRVSAGPDTSAGARVPPPSTSTVPPGPSSVASHPSHRNRLACRAIAVEGDVRVDTGRAGTPLGDPEAGSGPARTPLLLQGLVPTEAWLDLGEGARFVAKDPRTSRETTFRGPGRARACVDDAEESWLESGVFESSLGSGEAPGAEEWVVTPLGVVRYGAGKLRIDVGPKRVSVDVGAGTAFVWRAADTKPAPGDRPLEEGWQRVEASHETTIAWNGRAGGPLSLGAADASVAACAELARKAHDLAAALLGGPAHAGTMAEQVTTRRLARAACAVSEVRVRSLPPSEPASRLQAKLTAAMGLWSTLPPPGSPPEPLDTAPMAHPP
jgi:hypothetical protein